MHLTSQLIPALVCLLACTSNCLHGRELILLQEIIKTLNHLTETKVSKLSGTISPDVGWCRGYFFDCERSIAASREVGSWWLVAGWGAEQRLLAWHFSSLRDCRKCSQFEGVRDAWLNVVCTVGGNCLLLSFSCVDQGPVHGAACSRSLAFPKGKNCPGSALAVGWLGRGEPPISVWTGKFFFF